MARQVIRDLLATDVSDSKIAMIGASVVGAVAGQFSSVQLFNPVDSGVKLILFRLRVESTSYFVAPTTTPLSVLTTDSFNKFLGTEVPVGEIRTQQSAGAPTVARKIGVRAPANVGIAEIILTDFPGIILPGIGVVAFTTIVNAQISGLFEWVENTI